MTLTVITRTFTEHLLGSRPSNQQHQYTVPFNSRKSPIETGGKGAGYNF